MSIDIYGGNDKEKTVKTIDGLRETEYNIVKKYVFGGAVYEQAERGDQGRLHQ